MNRSVSFFAGCFGLLIAFLMGAFIYSEAIDSLRLVSRGRATVAEVVDCRLSVDRRRNGIVKINNDLTLHYDGHSKTIGMGRKEYERGTLLPVVYLPSNPSVMKFGDSRTTFVQFFRQDIGFFFFLFVSGVFAASVYGTVVCFRNLIKGEPAEKAEN